MTDPTPSQSPDFQLRPAQNGDAPAAPVAPGQAPPAPGAATGTAGSRPGMLAADGLPSAAGGGMSSTELVLAVAITAALGLLFLVARGAVRGHLIGERASLSAANNAGWAAWAFLCSVAVLVVFGVAGGLFGSLAFTVPVGMLVLATLGLAVATWRGALRRRR